MSVPEEGIYIGFTDILGGAIPQKHKYLVYHDGNGNARVIRGGPSGVYNSKNGWAGYLDMEVDVPLNQSKDAYGPRETPDSRMESKLVSLRLITLKQAILFRHFSRAVRG